MPWGLRCSLPQLSGHGRREPVLAPPPTGPGSQSVRHESVHVSFNFRDGRAASPLQLPLSKHWPRRRLVAASRAARLCGDDSLRSALGALALPRRRAIHLDVGSCVHLAVGSSLSRAVPRLVYRLRTRELRQPRSMEAAAESPGKPRCQGPVWPRRRYTEPLGRR